MWGRIRKSVFGCAGRLGERCGKVCWGVGRGMGKCWGMEGGERKCGEILGEVWQVWSSIEEYMGVIMK